jgi:CRP-like cAMP-binding protein
VTAVTGDKGGGNAIDFTRIRLLADLDRVSLVQLIPIFEEVRVKSGEILFRTGEEGDAFFIIVEGIVRVFQQPGGKDLEIACLGPGEWFGDMALLTGEPRSTDTEAQTDLVLLKLSRDNFDQLIRKHPSLGVSLAGLLAAKLVSTNALMRGSSGDSQASSQVTGVVHPDTALPVAREHRRLFRADFGWVRNRRILGSVLALAVAVCAALALGRTDLSTSRVVIVELLLVASIQIGRASCRERVSNFV